MAKIMLILPDADCGGAQRVMFTLSGQFAKSSHQVSLIVVRGGGVLECEIPDTVSVRTLLPRSTPRILLPILAFFHICWQIQRQKPDAILSSITGTNLIAVVARRIMRRSTALVIRHENTAPDLKTRLRGILVKHLYPLADKIITVSEPAAIDLTYELKIPSSLVTVVHNSVDAISIRELAKATTACAWMENRHIPVVLAIGRLEEQKDFGTLISAFHKVSREVPLRLVILGEGSQRAQLEEKVRQLQLESRVFMPGVVSNPYPWIRSCSLFVLSSRWEGQPVVLIEAMILGANIVATDCRSGPRELLGNGQYGMLVPVGDSDALAIAMKNAISKSSSNASPFRHEIDFSPSIAANTHLFYLLQ